MCICVIDVYTIPETLISSMYMHTLLHTWICVFLKCRMHPQKNTGAQLFFFSKSAPISWLSTSMVDFKDPWSISYVECHCTGTRIGDGIEAPIPGSNEPMKDEDWSGNVLLGNNLVVLGVLWFFNIFWPPKIWALQFMLKNFCWTASVGNSWVGENTGQFIIVTILGICVHQLYHISYVVALTTYIYDMFSDISLQPFLAIRWLFFASHKKMYPPSFS